MKITGTQYQPAQVERITQAELNRRKWEDAQSLDMGDTHGHIAKAVERSAEEQPDFDLHGGDGFDQSFILARMPAVLNEVRRSGHDVSAECPECHHVGRAGYARSFFSTPATGYSYWTCRHCDHRTTTRGLLGLAWTAQPRPSVKEWIEILPSAENVEKIRTIYDSLTLHCHAESYNNERWTNYIESRGLDIAYAHDEQIGYLDWPSYMRWWSTLDAELQQDAVKLAGLPDGSSPRAYGFAQKFAGGHQGKIVFPYLNEYGQTVDIRTRSISQHDGIGYMSPRRGYAERGVNVPYGVELLESCNQVILTEGEFKRLVPMCHSCDLPIVSLRGTSDPIESYLPYLRGKLVILAFDNDDTPSTQTGLTPGQTATIQIGRQLQAHHINVMVLNPALLAKEKGLDDFVNRHGIQELNATLRPNYLSTLKEFETAMRQGEAKPFKLTQPRGDMGTARQWTPEEHVDTHAHVDVETVDLDEAGEQITETVSEHLDTWLPGQPQKMVTASAGVGKTYATIQAANEWAEKNNATLAYIFPTHEMIDEKLAERDADGQPLIPPNTLHVYGHRNDDEITLCQNSEVASELIARGYNASSTVCPSCPLLSWCETEGYKAQFKNKRQHKAYVHAHAFSHYPGQADAIVIDELTHKQFIETTTIELYDIHNVVQSGKIEVGDQLDLLHAFAQMINVSAHGDLSGQTFYTVLERYYPALRTSTAWRNSLDIGMALDQIALDFVKAPEIALPHRFTSALFAVMIDDIERLNRGQNVSGRIQLRTLGTKRVIEIVTRKNLPDWYHEKPVIILNATADATVMESVAGPLRVVNPQVALRDGNRIVQDITRNHAMSSLIGDTERAQAARVDWLSEIQKYIDHHEGGEKDTVIICAKAVEECLRKRFPHATIAHYHALEGRNDLQAGLTILATPPPISLDAIRREAAALWPGVDTSLLRQIVAFDQTNANGEFLTVEQIDGLDPRVQALIWQYRDAAAIQAVHRARLVRNTGRTVAILFSRPIPGVVPTEIVTERKSPAKRAAIRTAQTVRRLTAAAVDLIHEGVGFTLSKLTELAHSARKTTLKYWEDITKDLGLKWFDMPALQPLANGAQKTVTVRMAFSPETMAKATEQVRTGKASNLFMALGETIAALLPDGWAIDHEALGLSGEQKTASNPTLHERSTPNNLDPIGNGSSVQSEVSEPPELPPSEAFSAYTHRLLDADGLKGALKVAASVGLSAFDIQIAQFGDEYILDVVPY